MCSVIDINVNIVNAVIEKNSALLDDKSKKIVDVQMLLDSLQETTNTVKWLLNELNRLNSVQNTPAEPILSAAEYHTDEEELEKETEWKTVEKRRNKKRKASSPPLSSPNDDNKITTVKTNHQKQPPPIFVSDLKSCKSLICNLNKITTENESFIGKSTGSNSLKINAKNEASYREIRDYLKKNNNVFHTYENKSSRPIRVVAKGLSHTWTPEDVEDYLRGMNYKIENVTPKLSWKDKKPLNMFILSFSNNENINNIAKIKYILQQSVEIVPLKGTKLIAQCKNCQEFGHTRNFCGKNPRCVKCAGDHLTAECIKPKESTPKCVNCDGEHPASYRGCIIAKELQKIRNKKNTKTQQERKEHKKSVQENKHEKNEGGNIAEKINSNQEIPITKTEKHKNIDVINENILQQLLKEMNEFQNSLKQINDQCKDIKERLTKIENKPKPGRKSKGK